MPSNRILPGALASALLSGLVLLPLLAAGSLPGRAQAADAASSPAPGAAIVTNNELQSAIMQKLQNDTSVNSFVVTAAVTDGAVKLNGTVDTPAEKDRVGSAVQSIPGVKSLDNQISVSADELADSIPAVPPPSGASVPAMMLTAQQQEALDPQARLIAALAANKLMSNVSAAVNGQDVYIFGTVDNKLQLGAAEQIARKTLPGTAVHDLILVYKNGA